jgi:NAD(P)-dependent dehydrogenase (short-subunit alcohol dehydrogenase family)
MAEFEDKVVIVTGAGRGIGRETALEFARRGARLVVNDLGTSTDGHGHDKLADAVVQDIRAAGGTAVANYNSVADKNEAKAIVDQAVSEFGGVDILINNAGILRNRTFKNASLEDLELVMQVHLLGSCYVTHAAWPIMYANNYGRVVLTSSVSGIHGAFGQSVYGAAFMGMLGLMNCLALEGKPHNIHVNCIAPGADTRMTALIKGSGIDADAPRAAMHPKLVAPAALYLASENGPNGLVIHAVGNSYFRTETIVNSGITLGTNASYEDLLEQTDELLDLSEYEVRGEGWNFDALNF